MRFREQLDDLHEEACEELSDETKATIEERLQSIKEGKVITTKEMRRRLKESRETTKLMYDFNKLFYNASKVATNSEQKTKLRKASEAWEEFISQVEADE